MEIIIKKGNELFTCWPSTKETITLTTKENIYENIIYENYTFTVSKRWLIKLGGFHGSAFIFCLKTSQEQEFKHYIYALSRVSTYLFISTKLITSLYLYHHPSKVCIAWFHPIIFLSSFVSILNNVFAVFFKQVNSTRYMFFDITTQLDETIILSDICHMPFQIILRTVKRHVTYICINGFSSKCTSCHEIHPLVWSHFLPSHVLLLWWSKYKSTIMIQWWK